MLYSYLTLLNMAYKSSLSSSDHSLIYSAPLFKVLPGKFVFHLNLYVIKLLLLSHAFSNVFAVQFLSLLFLKTSLDKITHDIYKAKF